MPAMPPEDAARPLGRVSSNELAELSGLVASRSQAGILWAHNDRGPSRLFALTTDGRIVATFDLAGVVAHDWEDIAVGPGPEPGRAYLYVADTGAESSAQQAIVRVPEPVRSVAPVH